jgi:RNA polymerase sigma-70 factor (ECF subfamily)
MSDIMALVRRWQSGDERAAEDLYDQHRGLVFSLACALLDDPADAEEVMQEVLTYVLTHIERYDSERARFATWLHTITVSRCRNRLRHRLSRPPSVTWLSDDEHADSEPGPEAHALRQALTDEVWAAIQRLNQPLREAVVLRYWSDYTYHEIAAILGCSLGTAQSRVRLAHERLRTLLDADALANLVEVLE